MFERLFIWLFVRPWPIWVMALVAAFHLLVVATASADQVTFTNKIFSAAMQVFGGGFVLFSISGNIGLFREKHPMELLLNYLSECPLVHRSVVAYEMSGTGGIRFAGAAATSKGSSSLSLEERVEELERLSIQLRRDIEARHEVALKHIDDTKAELKKSISQQRQVIENVASKLDEATVGSFKLQMFGAMLAIWGAGTSVFA